MPVESGQNSTQEPLRGSWYRGGGADATVFPPGGASVAQTTHRAARALPTVPHERGCGQTGLSDRPRVAAFGAGLLQRLDFGLRLPRLQFALPHCVCKI